jgi:hypothetical protein
MARRMRLAATSAALVASALRSESIVGRGVARTVSFHAETERVPRGVEEHPERRTRLMVVLGRAKLEHCCLGDI